MHAEDEQIQRFLHGELDPGSRRELLEHVVSCAPCKLALAEAEREEEWIAERFSEADHRAPAADPQWILRRARRPARRVWQRVAAALVILAAAGVAYSAPGSPLPMWVARVARWFDSPAEETRTPKTRAESESPAPLATAGGIAVTPGERFTIRFVRPQASGIATVQLSPGAEITARVYGGEGTFTAGAGLLRIENQQPAGNYVIEIPASAPWVSIEVGDRELFRKEGARIVTAVPATQGLYLLPLAGPGARGGAPGAQ
jgi:hypothetical protein